MVLGLIKNRYNDWQQKAEQSKEIHVYFTDILLTEYHDFLFVLLHKHVPFSPKTLTGSKAIEDDLSAIYQAGNSSFPDLAVPLVRWSVTTKYVIQTRLLLAWLTLTV